MLESTGLLPRQQRPADAFATAVRGHGSIEVNPDDRLLARRGHGRAVGDGPSGGIGGDHRVVLGGEGRASKLLFQLVSRDQRAGVIDPSRGTLQVEDQAGVGGGDRSPGKSVADGGQRDGRRTGHPITQWAESRAVVCRPAHEGSSLGVGCKLGK